MSRVTQVEIFEVDGKFYASIDGAGTKSFSNIETLYEHLLGKVSELHAAINSAYGTFKR